MQCKILIISTLIETVKTSREKNKDYSIKLEIRYIEKNKKQSRNKI